MHSCCSDGTRRDEAVYLRGGHPQHVLEHLPCVLAKLWPRPRGAPSAVGEDGAQGWNLEGAATDL